ncbi:MAG: large conductance mechanosensitive channel protein MscL [Cohaesibacter sp.]|jgi:large conductance mechanosensitive channel|nr:large conductance mechanosensitive channel protein MscL [Cohaesibacter sp.]
MLKEFQDFIAKGNVMDLAVGVIIGGAFALIVKSLTGDIIMPLVGVVFGGLDFSNYFLPLSDSVTATSLAEAKKQGAVLAWGNFLTVALNFLILAWIIFMLVKSVNRLRAEAEKMAAKEKEEEEAKEEPQEPAQDIALLTEIRDLLAAKKA